MPDEPQKKLHLTLRIEMQILLENYDRSDVEGLIKETLGSMPCVTDVSTLHSRVVDLPSPTSN